MLPDRLTRPSSCSSVACIRDGAGVKDAGAHVRGSRDPDGEGYQHTRSKQNLHVKDEEKVTSAIVVPRFRPRVTH